HRAVAGAQRDVLVAGTDGIARQREPTVRNDGDMAEPAGIDLQRVTGRQVHGAVACEGVGAVTPAASAGGIGLVFTPEPETFPVERIARRMRATGQYRSKDQQPAAHQKGTVNFQSSRPLPSVFDMHNPAAPRVMLRSVQQRSGCTASGLFRSRGLGTRPAAIWRLRRLPKIRQELHPGPGSYWTGKIRPSQPRESPTPTRPGPPDRLCPAGSTGSTFH